MPKPHTFPTLYDEVISLSISKLRQWGYLAPNRQVRTTLTWSSRGHTTGSIDITVCTDPERPYIELDYKYQGHPVKYRVELVSLPANIGKGQVWYFLCPATWKRCRKLYNIGGKFLHREAYRGCMYESQTRSHRWRLMDKAYGPAFKLDELYHQLYSKHFRTRYAGKPTKKYLRLMKQIRKGESYSPAQIEALYFL